MSTDNLKILERPMTDLEFAGMNQGFHEYSAKHGNPAEKEERFGFVACDGEVFVGCSSALVYQRGTEYGNWAYLTDLFVEEAYRKSGLGAQLLKRLEERIISLGIKYMYTWTAGYEAPGFYKKQGYEVFTELQNWYKSGHSRVGLHKKLGLCSN